MKKILALTLLVSCIVSFAEDKAGGVPAKVGVRDGIRYDPDEKGAGSFIVVHKGRVSPYAVLSNSQSKLAAAPDFFRDATVTLEAAGGRSNLVIRTKTVVIYLHEPARDLKDIHIGHFKSLSGYEHIWFFMDDTEPEKIKG